MKLTAEEFVIAWQGASSVKDLAKTTGVEADALYRRSQMLRKKGVPLKQFPRGAAPLDVKALIKLAQQHAPTTTNS